MDKERKLHNARIFRAIANIREAIAIKKKYGIELTEKENAIIKGE